MEKKKNPKFSIIVPHFEGVVNKTRFLEMFDSLTDQTFRDFEVLIYHDGPMKEDWPIKLEDAPQLVKLECTKKRADVWGHNLRNKGINECSGEIIFTLNADNVLYPHALEELDKYFQMSFGDKTPDAVIPAVKMIGSAYVFVRDEMASYVKFAPPKPQEITKDTKDLYPCLILNGLSDENSKIDAMQLVATRRAWDTLGGWNSWKFNADWIIYTQMLQKLDLVVNIGDVIGEHW